MTPAIPKQPVPWWMDVLRRDGILTVLVLVYLFLVAIPESQERREVMRDIQSAVARVAECEITQSAAVAKMHEFAAEVRRTHDQQDRVLERIAAERRNPMAAASN